MLAVAENRSATQYRGSDELVCLLPVYRLPLRSRRYGDRRTFLLWAYFFQKEGLNTTSSVKISSRPSSMAKVQTQVWKSLRSA